MNVYLFWCHAPYVYLAYPFLCHIMVPVFRKRVRVHTYASVHVSARVFRVPVRARACNTRGLAAGLPKESR